MKVYPTSKIRNIALVGHGGTGKTSLAEAMIFNAGTTKRLGKVDDGNTIADFYPEEINKKITISTALVPCEYKEHKINVLDTPGYSDFYFEVVGTMKVVDSMVMLISANSGVEVQTEIIWNDFPDIPKLVYINKMDRENADFNKSLDDLKNTFTDNVVPIQLPIGAEEDFKGVVDLITMKAYLFEKETGKVKVEDIPQDMLNDAEAFKEELIEAAAEADDDLLMKYLEGEELTDDEIKRGIKEAATNGSAVFVFCGSAINNMAITPLMDFIVDCAATPDKNILVKDKDIGSEPLSAQVFKTIADPYIGRLNMFRLYTGKLKAESTLYNSTKEKEEKNRSTNSNDWEGTS